MDPDPAPHDARSRDDAARWDERYSADPEAIWSGRPNGTFVAELTGRPAGRALDVGCGEGADAIWLAQQGWQVTAVDISTIAIDRARRAADLAGVAVDWQRRDVLHDPPAPRTFDLVTIQYPALLRSAGTRAIAALLDAVAAGGTLLVVGHALGDPDHARRHGFDPAEYVDVDQIAGLLGDGFVIEAEEVRPRRDPPPGSHHIDDVVLRARRR